MAIRFPLFPLRALLFGASLLLPAAASAQDAAFLAARDAFAAGNRQLFERHAAGLQSYPLAAYVEYYRLKMDLERTSPDAVAIFLERNADTVIAQRLRSDWLRLLAKNEQWSSYRAEYAKLPVKNPSPENDLRCHAARALQVLGDPAAAKPLAELLRKPGMAGHAWTDIDAATRDIPASPVDTSTRECSLRELILARALYRCGDCEGLGESILQQYAKDLRGHYARHALAILDEKRE